MKKFSLLFMLLTMIFVLFSCAAKQPPKPALDIDFAQAMARKMIDGEPQDWKEVDAQLAAMTPTEMLELKKLLFEVLAQDPPITTSIAGRWLIYSVIYEIDDILWILPYTTVVEGTFEWERAATLVGTTDLDLITDDGRLIPIFTTVATVDKDNAYSYSDGRRVRLYIKEEHFSGGYTRNNVLKIEALY